MTLNFVQLSNWYELDSGLLYKLLWVIKEIDSNQCEIIIL